MTVLSALDPVLDYLFPPRCPLCTQPIADQTGLCASCWNALVLPSEPACALCSRPFTDPVLAGTTCAPCLADPPRHHGIFAATLYTEVSRKLVLALKHGQRVSLARMMARPITARLGFVEPGWLVVPVPLHRWRLWRRGYNQAAELAREIAQGTGARLSVDALWRRKRTPSLGGLGKRARKRALAGAIRVNPRRTAALKGANIVLVDDVLTSGATSNACVAALRRAGAQKVVIACFARVIEGAAP